MFTCAGWLEHIRWVATYRATGPPFDSATLVCVCLWNGIESTYGVCVIYYNCTYCLAELVNWNHSGMYFTFKGEKFDKIDVTKLRPSVDHPWSKLADFERLLCFSAAKLTRKTYTSTSAVSLVMMSYIVYCHK